MVQQQTGLFQVPRRPHQRRCVRVIVPVGVRAQLQQPGERRCIRVKDGVHERSGAFRPTRVEQRRIGAGSLEDGRQVTVAQRFHHRHSQRVCGRQVLFVGEGVRPFGALVNPVFDRCDLLWAQRACWGHLRPVLGSGHAVIDKAIRAAAGPHAPGEGLNYRTLAVQAQATLL